MLMARAYALAEVEPERWRLMGEGEWEKVKVLLDGERMRGGIGLRCLQMMEGWMLPGISLHYLARKRWIEVRVRRALARGAERVLMVGAGMDVLGWRLAEEGVEVVEIDHPATQALKTSRMGERVPERWSAVAADLYDEFPGGLALKRTVVVMEGVTMYLEEEVLSRLLRSLAGIVDGGSELLMTVMDEREKGCWDFRGQHPLVRWWLWWRGEPFLWGRKPEQVAEWLVGTGFRVEEIAGMGELRREVLEPAGMAERDLAEGEYLVHAMI